MAAKQSSNKQEQDLASTTLMCTLGSSIILGILFSAHFSVVTSELCHSVRGKLGLEASVVLKKSKHSRCVNIGESAWVMSHHLVIQGKKFPRQSRYLLNLASSYDIGLEHGSADEESPEIESGQVDVFVLIVGDEFGECQAGRGRLLDPVTGKAVAKVQVLVIRMTADDAVLVVVIVIVITGPSVLHFAILEGWNAMRQNRPKLGW